MANPKDVCDRVNDLLTKLDSIQNIYVSAEEAVANEVGDINWGGVSSGDADEMRNFIEHMLQSIRQAMLILLYSCLENGMDLIGNEFIEDYADRVKRGQAKGSFNKRIGVFETAGFDLEKVRSRCQDADNLRLVRNCLAHAGGRMSKSVDRAELEAGVKRLQAKSGNCDFIDVHEGLLHLGNDIVSEANCVSWEIITHLHNCAPRGDSRKTVA